MTTYTERLRHERNRFSGMSLPQLRTRLNKITVTEKLRAFIQVADEHNLGSLRNLAIIRATELGYDVIQREGNTRVRLVPAQAQIDRDVRALRPGVETQPIPETRLPSTQEVIESQRSRIEGPARAQPPSEEQLEQYREEERIRQGVRKIRFNGKNKKEEDEPHQPRLPGMDDDPPW